MVENIKKLYIDRKEKLINLMENGEIKIERQHQIYGAINEIENIIGIIDNIKLNYEKMLMFTHYFAWIDLNNFSTRSYA